MSRIPIDNLANLRSVIEQLEGCIRERDALLLALQQSRQEISLAEEGLASYAQENIRLKHRCWALALLLYPAGEPREAVVGDID